MTKMGEDKNPPKRTTPELYHADLEHHIIKFASALAHYTKTKNGEKERHKALMDSHLVIILADTREIPTREMHKWGEKLAKDYRDYIAFNSAENYAAVEQDLQTLRECNQIKG